MRYGATLRYVGFAALLLAAGPSFSQSSCVQCPQTTTLQPTAQSGSDTLMAPNAATTPPALWPARRSRTAMAFVPGVGVVMLGGRSEAGTTVFSDMYVWNNSAWTSVQTSGVPRLHSHDMTWDYANHRLVVTGGYTDTNDTKNSTTYYLPFHGRVAGQWTTVPPAEVAEKATEQVAEDRAVANSMSL
jgi:hypothetical protein